MSHLRNRLVLVVVHRKWLLVDLLAFLAVNDQQLLLADDHQVVVVVAEGKVGSFELWLQLDQLVREVSRDLQVALKKLALSCVVEVLGVHAELGIGRDLAGDDRLCAVGLANLIGRHRHLDFGVLRLPPLDVLLEEDVHLLC